MTTKQISPYRIDVAERVLLDVRARVQDTLWPSTIAGATYGGPDVESMRELARRFLKFDWRRAESGLNRFPQFMTEIDGQPIHFIHLRSGKPDAIPLMLIHGWPGSIVEFMDVIEPLAEGSPAFDLVVPSLPGFGFSGPTHEPGWHHGRMSAALVELMDRLGYGRYAVQGGDAGAILGPEMGRLAPERIIGIHVNAATLGFMPFGPIDEAVSATFTDAERERVARMQDFVQSKFAFNLLHSHQPQLIAYALEDSPIGQMAWITQLFSPAGNEERFFTNFMIYWASGTMSSSIRMYYEAAHDPAAWAPKANSGVPTGVAVYQDEDIGIRHFSEASNTIVRWKEYPRGGHYAVMNAPEVWLGDVREFIAELSPER
jgi:pimeloyl-ACP methyl ester carboxylesterase